MVERGQTTPSASRRCVARASRGPTIAATSTLAAKVHRICSLTNTFPMYARYIFDSL
jgi:hypothetical protein